jgi:hypothetical protein
MLSTKLFAGAAALVLALSASAPAFAVCSQCNATVRFDSELATCFAARADDVLKKLTASGQAYLFVDLTDCASRGGLPTVTPTVKLKLDNLFVVDADSLKCLTTQVEAADDTTLDPSHLFDLSKDCPAQ